MKEFLTHLVVKPLGPLDSVAKRLTALPGAMVAIQALKAAKVEP
jgi:hypothetical protein